LKHRKIPPKSTLQKSNIFILYSCLILFWLSCQVYEINIDNPVDAIANAEMEVYPPALTMHPLTQTVSIGDSVTIGAYIVDHDTTLAGVHTHVTFNAEFLQLDTILPGVLFTNDGVSTPLFTYTTDFGQIDIFVWYLGSEGGLAYVTETGHIAEIYFTAVTTGETIVEYDITQCELVTPLNEMVEIQGIRNSTVIIQ
tara:strand:+ start:346 stop:936 length:591 start_codon:yes stop_codon:yes gene_type:complete